MKRLPLTWLGLATVAAMLASGCTAQPQTGNRINQSNLFTTTGDADLCATALGNTVGANAFWRGMAGVNENVTANGVIIGNVALVALPRDSQKTPVTGARAGTVPEPGFSTGLQRDGDVTGNLGTLTPPNTVDTTPDRVGAIPGNTGAPTGAGRATGDARTRTGAGTTTGGGTGTGAGTPGAGTNRASTGVLGQRIGRRTGTAGTPAESGAAAGMGTAAGTRVGAAVNDPLERVRTACPRVADIRVVNDENDRNRLAEIAAAVRAGRPITEFMTDLATISQRATSAGPGANARQNNTPQRNIQQGNIQSNMRQIPGPMPAPAAPGTGGRAGTPGRAGGGTNAPARAGVTPTDPGTSTTD